jgi:hypothetical protein
MDISKQEKYVDDLVNMNSPHVESLITYTTETGYSINRSLRDGTSEYKEIISNIDTIFNACPPLKYPILVYRTIDQHFAFDYKSEGYVSTSTTITTAGTTGNCCLLRITVPAGIKVLPLKKISTNPSENEILLPRDSSLQFSCESKEVIEDEEYIVIDMVVIPDHKSININYIGSETRINIKILDNIYTESRIKELIEESKDFGEDYDQFVLSLRLDIANTVDRLKLLNGIESIFLNYIRDELVRSWKGYLKQ